MQRLHYLIALSGIALSLSCGDNTSKRNGKAAQGASANPAFPNSGPSNFRQPTGPIAASTAELLRDTPLHSISDLQSTDTASCAHKNGVIRGDTKYLAWPANLKSAAVGAAEKLPNISEILTKVEGIYWVENTDEEYVGLMCVNGLTGQVVIWIHSRAISENQPQDLISEVRTTVIHELAHAIEYFKWGEFVFEPEKSPFLEFKNFSWAVDESPKYKAIPVYYTLHGEESAMMLADADLSQSSDPQIGSDMQYLERSTNFLSPYASANSKEDFAETLSIYFMGTRFNEWSTVTYQAGRSASVFDTERLAKSDPRRRQKICAAAKLAFGEDCNAFLK
jgi:hypothetical protein